MRWKAILTAATIATIAAGCAPAKMDVPESFVALDKDTRGPYDVRAVSADGVVMGCRTRDNPKHGTLSFWSEAAKNELAARPGYTLTANDKVESYSGVEGRLLVFSATRRGAAFTYMLGVFVKGDRVILAEAGGRAEAVKPLNAELRVALLSVR